MSRFTETVLKHRPLAYWPYSDSTPATHTRDLSGNGRHAQDAGSFVARFPIGYGPGGYGVDHTSAGTTIADAAWNSLTGAFTLMMAVTLDTTASHFGIEKYNSPARNGYILRYNNNVPEMWTLNAATFTNFLSTVTATANLHWLVFATFDGVNTGRIYMNGTETGSRTTMIVPTDGATQLRHFISGDGGVSGFNGKAAHLGIFDRMLSAGDIKELWNNYRIDSLGKPTNRRRR